MLKDKIEGELTRMCKKIDLVSQGQGYYIKQTATVIDGLYKSEIVKMLKGLKASRNRCSDKRVLAGISAATKEYNKRIDNLIKEIDK